MSGIRRGTDRRREVVRTAAAVRHTPAAGAVRTAAAKAEERSATEDEQPRRREEEERLLRRIERPRVYQRDPFVPFIAFQSVRVEDENEDIAAAPPRLSFREDDDTRAFLFPHIMSRIDI